MPLVKKPAGDDIAPPASRGAAQPMAAAGSSAGEDPATAPDMSFLESHKERKAAYGRLTHAVVATGDQDLIKYHQSLPKAGTTARWAKQKAILQDWIIDPSFARAKARYSISISNSEELKSDDEVVTAERLEIIEGKQRR